MKVYKPSLTRRLGLTEQEVFPIGLGCMGMSEFYGETNETESLTTLQKAFDLGVNFFDTADIYGYGDNERLIGMALKPYRDRVLIASKCGIVRNKNDPTARGIDCSPHYIKKACEGSLRRLGMSCIDLFYLHRMDRTIPIEESIYALSQLIEEGKIRYIGLSEASEDLIKRAHAVAPITALQTEYSLWSRSPEKGLLELCKKLGISFVAYSPLGRGFLTAKMSGTAHLSSSDFRRALPRFQEDNFQKNMSFVKILEEMSQAKGCKPAQLALSWVLSQGEHIIPIPGTKKHKYLVENVEALLISLTEFEKSFLDAAFPRGSAAGTRYISTMMEVYGIED